jgi:hypothetical protein
MSTATEFKETALDFPFRISADGTVATVNSQEAIWSNKVRLAISTLQKERVFFPSFGSKIGELFWNNESFAKTHVKSFIEEVFIGWLPTLTLQNVEVSNIDSLSQLTINISYLLPNDTLSQTAIGIISISGNLQPRQASV